MKTHRGVHLIARLIGAVAALPFVFMFRVQCLVASRDRSLQSVSQALSLLPDGIGTLARRHFYSGVLDSIGERCVVSFGVVFSKTAARLGNSVYLGRGCSIGFVDIGDDVLLGDYVHLLSGSKQHGTNDVATPIRMQAGEFSRISIGSGTWIGSGAIVMADVGAHAIVGAGSVVTRPVAAYSVVAGNPAVQVRDRRDVRPIA